MVTKKLTLMAHDVLSEHPARVKVDRVVSLCNQKEKSALGVECEN